ncbi:uncharacterized protein LOC131023652 [Salvia miltiorrhiza]|uniref:uncharacterized protein LOC131023652 n=1 Tax=Salvia miltiorrhiza TaxID=226208 RepID=UPI0025AC4EF1|nr:uncharacterized protein LOC131023652 [Salvia miltiorrhiza]
MEERRGGAPHAAVIAAVVVVVMVLPTLIGDQCGAVADSVAELLSPLGLLLLPISLILAIRFLSSDAGSSVAGILSAGNPGGGGGGGSTAGVVAFLLLVLLLLYSKVFVFNSGDDSE